MTADKESVIEQGGAMAHVPVYCVIDGRFFASARDKAILDRQGVDRGKPLFPVEVLYAAPTESFEFLHPARIGIVV